MRCGKCGNENAEGNRFCGMCGSALVAKTPVHGTGQQPAASSTSTAPSTPVITGPSLLGLNTPAGQADHDVRSGREAGPMPSLQPSSRSLDYLLDDEDEPKRGWGKLILVVVALVLAVGFGYLHWKQGGFAWVNRGESKPAGAEAAQSSADSGKAAASPAESGAGQATATQDATPSSAPSNAASQNIPAASVSAQSAPAASVASENVPSATRASDANLPASSAPPSAGSDSSRRDSNRRDFDRSSAPAEAAARPKAAAKKPAAAKPVDTVTEAERYIYGRGVHPDCDRGLRLLKRATDQSNAKAMISMGALYSTGTCTPRDLPTAYRWFALALHKEPDNQALQDDLQKLWGQMTQPERQLAIKLSQ